ncbi:MAG: hypothetical protein ABEH56_07855 [Salinirussus sp.]
MKTIKRSPGPAAADAFRLGMIASGVAGLATIGLLYWFGAIDVILAGYAVLVLFPIYLVLAAVLFSRWLGYDKDATALRPVYREQ